MKHSAMLYLYLVTLTSSCFVHALPLPHQSLPPLGEKKEESNSFNLLSPEEQSLYDLAQKWLGDATPRPPLNLVRPDERAAYAQTLLNHLYDAHTKVNGKTVYARNALRQKITILMGRLQRTFPGKFFTFMNAPQENLLTPLSTSTTTYKKERRKALVDPSAACLAQATQPPTPPLTPTSAPPSPQLEGKKRGRLWSLDITPQPGQLDARLNLSSSDSEASPSAGKCRTLPSITPSSPGVKKFLSHFTCSSSSYQEENTKHVVPLQSKKATRAP